jgi:hypothetical protein
MSALIDDDTNWWKRSLVEEIFIADEVERICRMVISPNKQADQLVWVGNKNGNVSVKSAYHLERDRIEMEGGSIAAHRMAKMALTIWEHCLWVGSFPSSRIL